MDIKANLERLLKEIPESVNLVAVSKTKPDSDILEAYDAGHRHFGENKVQDLIAKQARLPADIQWHFIGHLQTNKVKYIAPFVSLIESVDSLKLLKEIDKQARKNNRIIECLLQFHIAREYQKFGLSVQEANELLESKEYSEMDNIRIIGVMGMATLTEDKNVIESEFSDLTDIFHHIKTTYFAVNDYFKDISMGMSGDYKIAIRAGSTMIRVGSLIFGDRG